MAAVVENKAVGVQVAGFTRCATASDGPVEVRADDDTPYNARSGTYLLGPDDAHVAASLAAYSPAAGGLLLLSTRTGALMS